MKVAILAGGLGSRLAEETDFRPKPMIEIGGKPILWHIMMHYSHHNFRDFVVALGYKGEVIKRWMQDFALLHSDMSVNTGKGTVKFHNNNFCPWRVDLVDTGQKTQTGGRLRRLKPWLGNRTFMLTWGDGVGDIDLTGLLAFHKRHGRLATVTAVHPPARFGHFEFDGDCVTSFTEKPQTSEGWINGAYFVLEPDVLDFISSDSTHWEREPMERLAAEGQLMAYKHDGFWQCMDTLRDKRRLEQLWATQNAPWRVWE